MKNVMLKSSKLFSFERGRMRPDISQTGGVKYYFRFSPKLFMINHLREKNLLLLPTKDLSFIKKIPKKC